MNVICSKFLAQSVVRFGAKRLFGYENKSKVAIIGALLNKGQPIGGVENGPMVVRQTGFRTLLEEYGTEVLDIGNINPVYKRSHDVGPDGEKNFESVMAYNKELASRIAELMKDQYRCLTIGGDHSVGIGTVAGHMQGHPDKQVLLIWVDAHADINTGKSSQSKNIHGMTVSYLIKELSEFCNRVDGWPAARLSKNHIVYIGLRDIDHGEREILNSLNIKYFEMKHIDNLGINEVVARCMDFLKPNESNSIHMSFDIDSLDPLHAPSTGTPVPGGLTLREGMQVVEAAYDTGLLRGFDLVEVNPSIGTQENLKTTKTSAKAIIMSALAGARAHEL